MFESLALADPPHIPRVIIFGAGNAGRAAKRNLENQVEVIGFADNNPQVHSSELDGVPVFSAQQLATQRFDYVLIASEYFEQIRQQLVEDIHLDSHQIHVVPATSMKPLHFGDNKQIESDAVDVLRLISSQLEGRIRHFVDAGTLLGIYRDGALIPWDDDLDIAVHSEDVGALKRRLELIVVRLNELTGQPWHVEEYLAEQAYGAVNVGDVRSLKLRPALDNVSLPMVDFFIKYLRDEWMDYTLSSRGISMSSKFLLHTTGHLFEGFYVRIPVQTEAYLEGHYGDWRTPKKDWDLSELKSATVF